MKNLKKKLLILISALFIVMVFNVELFDNRDYPEDDHEIYLFDLHVGYYNTTYNTIEFKLTGK